MEFLSALQLLQLHRLPPGWVEAVWDSEFTDRTPLDPRLEEELTASGARACKALVQSLLDRPADGGDVSQSVWVILGENGLSAKSLVAVLSFFVLSGKTKAASVQQRLSALYAAAAYLLLLGIPGSIGNQVFHEVLFDTCSDLTSHCWPQDTGKKRKKEALKSSQGDGKRPKPPRKDAAEMEVDEAEDEEEEEEVHFSGQDLMKMREAVVVLVQSLVRLLPVFPLRGQPQISSSLAQVFSKLLYLEPMVGEPCFSAERDVAELNSIPELAFHGLQLLCSPKHGDQTESLRRVLQRLLWVILMMKRGGGGNPTLLPLTQLVLATKDHTLSFVCHLVRSLKEVAIPLLHILLQHLCSQMVERSEYRLHGSQSVALLVSLFNDSDYALFIQWLDRLSRSSKMGHRLFSVDVAMVLVERPERKSCDGVDSVLQRFLPHRFLIQELLFARRSDQSAVVQGHALSCLAQCLELPSLDVTQAVHHLFSTTGAQTVLENETTQGTIASQNTQKTFRSLPFRTVDLSSGDSSACEAKENVALLLRRVKDTKINVRKSALQALVGLLKHGVIAMSPENLETLSERSRDPAVSVKKKALQCLGELLTARPDSRAVQLAWLRGVLPAVFDSENSVQDKALETLEQVLLLQVKAFQPGRHLDSAQRLTWDLLDVMNHEGQNLSRYFSRAFSVWSKQKKLTASLISNLLSHTEAEHRHAAWLLLAKVAAVTPLTQHGAILDAWDAMLSSSDLKVSTCCNILSVTGDAARQLNDDTRRRLTDDVVSWMKSFSLPLEVISAAVETLVQLGHSDDIRQTQAFLNQHCGELVSACEEFLAKILLSENGARDLNEDLMIKHLHTLGVASLHCPARVGKRTVLLVESVLTSHADKLAGCEEELPASLPLSQFKANWLPSRVRAHGVITLGKLCLQQEDLVHKYLPVFARELEVGSEVAVRNNVVVVMCDLCVRYTNLVDLYIPNISACLRDPEAVVREQTLIMLTNLLQEDFVKWKGSLLYRFLITLVDPVPTIASLCEYCLLHQLLKKNPDMLSQHFIESIFHFNSYTKHKTYNRFPQTDREKQRFSLKGAKQQEKRFHIYRFLLEHFTDNQRFNVTRKINQTILAEFADEALPVDPDGEEILSETFKILSLKEMKLKAISGPAGGAAGGEEPEEDNMAAMAKAVLQKKVVTQVQKKTFIETTVPLIISLKHLLEEKRSPVMKDLMAYLQVTMQDYRSELKEMLAGDEQLAAEVEFALKKAEEQRLQEQMESCRLEGDTQVPAPASPLRSRPLLPNTFATPQPPRPNAQLAPRRSDWHVYKKQSEAPGSKSLCLERSVLAKGNVDNRAISTPKGVNINLTFEENLSEIFSDAGTSLTESSFANRRSNENRGAAVRQWNVQSPLRPSRASRS